MTGPWRAASPGDPPCADWTGLRVLVSGLGLTGFAAAARCSSAAPSGRRRRDGSGGRHDLPSGRGPDILGARRLGLGAARRATRRRRYPVDLVVTSPGVAPDRPAGRGGRRPASRSGGRPSSPGGCVHGRGRGTVALGDRDERQDHDGADAGRRSWGRTGCARLRAGNVGTPLVEAVLHPEPYDVLAVELSSFQLHRRSPSRRGPSVCLNLAPDHVDWHGTYDEYVAAKGAVYERTAWPASTTPGRAHRRLARPPTSPQGCRAVGFSLGVPGASVVGVVDDVLADRAFVPRRTQPPSWRAGHLRRPVRRAPRTRRRALAAAALARAAGVSPGRSEPASRSRLTRTASPRSGPSTASPTSTTPRPRTRTRR